MDLPEIENTLYEVAKVGLPSFIRVGRQPDPVDVAAGTAEEDRPIPLRRARRSSNWSPTFWRPQKRASASTKRRSTSRPA
jgi:hypothetical protein